MPTIELDMAVPALVLKLCPNVVQHGALGIIRSLGRFGVPVYARVEDRFAPAAMSRYLTGAFIWESVGLDADSPMTWMATVGERLGRPAILVPTDDLAAAFVAEHADAFSENGFCFRNCPEDFLAGWPTRRTCTSCAGPWGCHARKLYSPVPSRMCTSSSSARYFQRWSSRRSAVSVPVGFRRVSIAHTAKELLAIYRQAESRESKLDPTGIHSLISR